MVTARKRRLGWMAVLAAGLCVGGFSWPDGGLMAQESGPGGPTAGTYDGFTRPSLEVTVGSRVDGLVAEVLVEEGQTVRKGQVLVRLDATIEKIEVELSRIRAEGRKQVEAMELIEKQKAAELTRGKILLDKGGVTGQEYEQMQLALEVARLNVEVGKAEQRAAVLRYQRDLARLAEREIKAPVDGVVTHLFKDPGEAVERLEKVAEVVQLDPLEIVLNLRVATRGKYAAGQKARVRVAGADAWHPATVKMVDPVVDFASGTYRLKVRLPNPGGKLQAGLRVTVDLTQ